MRTNNSRRIGPARKGAAFTLIELLVVISIIALLVGILMPALARAKALAKQVTCLTNVKGQLTAVHLYAADHDGRMPVGPDFPLFGPGTPPTNQVASNNIWIGPARCYNAHGVIIGKGLSDPKMLFCPDDDTSDPVEELAKITGRVPDGMAYCSYFYRQLDARDPAIQPSTLLDDLGKNGAGDPATALILDANSLLVMPGVPTRTNHRAETVSIGFASGYAQKFDNSDGNLTLTGDVPGLFARLDSIFEHADLYGRR